MSLGRLVSTNFLLKSTTRTTARFHPDVRLFATHHVRTLKPRSSVILGLGSTRNLSFWRSKPPTPSPVPSPSPDIPEEILNNVSQPEALAEITPVPEAASISESVTSLDIPSIVQVPPLNYGDLAALGFSNWTPAGIVQWTLELIQVSSGMSWFWTIVTVTIISRMVIFPFNVKAIRATARLAPHNPRLTQLREELQRTGGLTKDPAAVQRITLQQKKIYEEARVSLLDPVLNTAVQIPITLGMFFGIKSLCAFPLEQLKVGGIGWITDLTAADPLYVLPLAMAVMINAHISITAKDFVGGSVETVHLFNLFKVVGVLSPLLMMHFPAGLMLTLVTGITVMGMQALVLRVPSVREAFDLPKIPNHLRTKPPTFSETAKFGIEWFKAKGVEAEARARAQQKKKF